MALEFKMPQLGESVVEGTIGKWLKKVGDSVQEFEPLLEVSTDKVDTEIPSPASGVILDLRAREGETVRVGQVIAVIGRVEEQVSSRKEQWERESGVGIRDSEPGTRDSELRTQHSELASARPGGRGYLTPVVARLAAEHKLDLSLVQGTGRQGRVTKKDLLRFMEQRSSPEAVPAAELRPPPAVAERQPARPAAVVRPAAEGGDTEVPLSKMRQSIVRHMRLAKDTAAHVTTFMEVDLSRVAAYRVAHRAEFEAEGLKLTYTPFFVQALVAALKAYPVLNAVLAEDKMIYRRAIHIGIAVDLGEEGLIVPVVKNADEKSLRGLARAVSDLAARARSRTLAPEEVQGGTFTLTNHGITGSLAGTPIIPMPQVGILGVGAVQKRAVVIETEWGDTIAIRPMAYLSLSFDHRAIDGATADRFLGTVKAYLEEYRGG